MKKQDPRYKNTFFSTQSLTTYMADYANALSKAYQELDQKSCQKFVDEIESAITEGRTVFSCGNGGSASIADQMATDWGKGIFMENFCQPRIISLSANNSSITAYGNDLGYEFIFSEQLKMLGKSGDVYLAISSSGNSPNVIQGAKTAIAMGMKTLSLTGFSGGMLKEISDICIHVPHHNYGIAEDCHQGIMHLTAQYLFLRFQEKQESKFSKVG